MCLPELLLHLRGLDLAGASRIIYLSLDFIHQDVLFWHSFQPYKLQLTSKNSTKQVGFLMCFVMPTYLVGYKLLRIACLATGTIPHAASLTDHKAG
jgi:hypothetical protein